MRVRFDEHVAPTLVSAVQEIAGSADWEISSVLHVGHHGYSDEHWITAFAHEGGKAIISADRDFLSLEPQINAVFDTGIRVIHLPSRWAQSRISLQTAFIFQWWARIEETIKNMHERECYRPEWNISEVGKMKKIKIDFQKAQKLRRKNNRKP